jgi:hypothetical protein
MTDPFTLITMLCWLGGAPDYSQGNCDVQEAEYLKTKNYMECSFRAREFVRQNEDPLFKHYGGTHKIAFCVEDLVVDSLLDDDQAFNVDQYAEIWATGDVKTTYVHHHL